MEIQYYKYYIGRKLYKKSFKIPVLVCLFVSLWSHSWYI